MSFMVLIWTASSELGTYRLCEQPRFRRACASAQSRQNLRCSLIQAVSQEEPSDRKLDPWPLWMSGHAQLKFVMTECSKTQIRLMGLIYLIVLFSKFQANVLNKEFIDLRNIICLRKCVSFKFSKLALVCISYHCGTWYAFHTIAEIVWHHTVFS